MPPTSRINLKTFLSDDLETFFNDLKNNKIIMSEALSFFTPKLTDEELALVEDRNKQHLDTYSKNYDGKNPDVDADEMKRSDSKSKYVHARCWRLTTQLTLEGNQKHSLDETDSIAFENAENEYSETSYIVLAIFSLLFAFD